MHEMCLLYNIRSTSPTRILYLISNGSRPSPSRNQLDPRQPRIAVTPWADPNPRSVSPALVRTEHRSPEGQPAAGGLQQQYR
jgi:hypothetical protein